MKFYDAKTYVQTLAKKSMQQNFALFQTVVPIIEAVIERGDAALFEYNLKFDGVSGQTLKVSKAQMLDAYNRADARFIEALILAKNNIEKFHEAQRLNGYDQYDVGKQMGQIIMPIRRVGIYVPGGEAAYPSTLLMNVIPARIAGVEEIVIVTPPQKDPEKLEALLTAMHLLEIEEAYLVGGVQAIAALAYGTQTIKPVDKITGPGNQYVTAAKKWVFGDVGIDMIAGPSEILILSDGTVPLSYVASDMLAQLEHDTQARAILLTTSIVEANGIKQMLMSQSADLSRQTIVSQSLAENVDIVRCDTLEQAVEIANKIAPEHLELLVAEPFDYLKTIRNAGAVFLGAYTPETVGDYTAGPNHTLPTMGSARYTSPLGTYDFQKRMNYLYYDATALENDRAAIEILTEKERLQAHGKAVTLRTPNLT